MTKKALSLDTLLTRWRKRPAPALADAIERISRAGGDAELTARLQPSALKAKVLDDTAERLRALRPLLPDPRVARALVDFAREVPFTSNSSQKVWTMLFDLIVDAGDPRALAWLDGIFTGKQIRGPMMTWLDAKVMKTRERLAEAFPGGAPSLPAKESAALEALVAELAPPEAEAPSVTIAKKQAAATARSRDELLAAIYGAPTDDGPRLVLADVLLEAGDPRGEFIALQCRRAPDEAPSARERELEKKHGREWLGDVGRFIHLSGDHAFAYRRGFVSTVSVKYKSTSDVAFARDLPGWATVEEFHCGWSGDSLPRTARAVDRIIGGSETTLRTLLEIPEARPTVIELSGLPSDYTLFRQFEISPQAERVHTVGNMPLEWLLASPILPHLREIAFGQRERVTDAHLAAILARPSLRLRAEVWGAGTVTIGRDDAGLVAATLRPLPVIANNFTQALQGLGRATIQSLAVILDGKPPKNVKLLVDGLTEWAGSLEALRTLDLGAIGGKVESRRPKRATVELAPQSLLENVRRLDWSDAGLVVVRRRGLSLIDPETGEIRKSHITSDENVWAIRRDGGVLFARSLIDVRTGATTRTLPAYEGQLGRASRDGRWAWTWQGTLIDVDSGTVEKMPKVQGGIAAMNAARTRLVASFNNTISLYPVEGGRAQEPVTLMKSSAGLIWMSEDGERVLVVESRPTRLMAFSAGDGAQLYETALDTPSFLQSAVSGPFVAIATDENVTVIDDRTGAIRYVKAIADARGIGLSADGERLFVLANDTLTAYGRDGKARWSVAATRG